MRVGGLTDNIFYIIISYMTLFKPRKQTKREILVIILQDGTKLKMLRYGKRKGLKDLSEVARLAIKKLLAGF